MIQMYGSFEGFPYIVHLFGLFMTPCLESFIFKFEEIGTVQNEQKIARSFLMPQFFCLSQVKAPEKTSKNIPHLLSILTNKF